LEITEYLVPSAASQPSGITAGPDGALWFTEYVTTSKIGRITTAGVITEHPVPSGTEAWMITTGLDGELWFTGNNTTAIGALQP
jgi:virginiamycin B lyase